MKFNLYTKFGVVGVTIQGFNSVYVQSVWTGDGVHHRLPITIRNKPHSCLGIHFKINPKTGLFSGLTYALDGNTPTLVADNPHNEYFKARAVYMNEGDSFNRSSEAAKKAIYEEVESQLNNYYQLNKPTFEAVWREAKIARHNARLTELNQEISDLNKQAADKQNEFTRLHNMSLEDVLNSIE